MRLLIALTLVAAGANTAFAQPLDRPARQAGAAVEWSSLTEAFGGALDLRGWRGSFGVELAGASSTSETEREYRSGVVRIHDATSRTYRVVAVSALARAGRGRFRAIGGFGPALYSIRTRTRTRFDGIPSSDTTSGGGTLGLRMLADLEVAIAARLSGTTGLRVDLHSLKQPGTSSGSIVAGLRFSF